MKIIKEARKNIATIWRRPEPKQVSYRPMKFLLKKQVEEGLILYNVVTTEMILLDEREMALFESSPKTYNKEMDELIAKHFLVKEDFDENRSVLQLRALLRKIDTPTRVTAFTILPTTDCNARCFYCFESNYDHCTLTEKTANDVVAYMITKCKGEPIEIGWFGGEPLVAHKRISQICAGLKNNNVVFKSSMVSNAFLFDEKLVQHAKEEWKLNNVQVTLDGTEEVYNNTKAYINPRCNPYRRVLNNIGLLLEAGIRVNVRLNVTDKNINDLYDLIDELCNRFKGKDGFSCYSHAVYEDVGFNPLSYDNQTRELIDIQTLAIDSKLREKGLLGSITNLPALRSNHCMADNSTSRLIYPDGTIGKCENKPPEDGIGDIYHDIIDGEMDELYRSFEYQPECENCSLFPYCINLKLCPENGKCTNVRRRWKLDTYERLIEHNYHMYRENVLKDLSKISV